MLLILLGALFCSFAIGVLLVRFRYLHDRFTADHDMAGVQKFHAIPVPRIGGVVLMSGLLSALVIMTYFRLAGGFLLSFLLLAALPVFLAGLVEDLFKNVRPLFRLLASFFSAGAAMLLLDTTLHDIHIPLLSQLLALFPVLALLLTLFAVGGVSHALNIIDGYNGLMAGYAVMVVAALGTVCYQVGDTELLGVCVVLAGALTGFWLVNFPRGLIFAGDAGAYFVGFMLAEISILLVNRHEGLVSPWFPMLLMVYPVVETLFSAYRKRCLRHMSPGLPDGLHLHMLIYKRLVRWRVGSRLASDRLARNSLTSPYLWGLSLCSIMPAVLFWQRIQWLQSGCLLFVILYVWFYWRLVHFRSPRWLRLQVSCVPSRPSCQDYQPNRID